MSHNDIYVSAYIMGGLGNQLFQVFAAIALSLGQSNLKFVFPYYELSPGITKRVTYWNTFLSKLLPFTTHKTSVSIQDINNFFILRERFHYYCKFPDINNNTLLFGYFQSYKYFHHFLPEILDLIDYHNIRSNILNEYNNYFDFIDIPSISIISLHFRFGDYVGLDGTFELLNSDYYISAIKHIIYKDLTYNVRILYFFESQDSVHVSPIIEKIKEYTNTNNDFSFQHVNVSHNIDDWKQLVLMSCCNHNIIANSSFSWWGAYLNPSNYKQVCYPKKWFGKKEQKKQSELQDMFPSDWIII